MKFKNELITPSIAKMYLERNTNNRNVSTPTLFRYANDMAAGRWRQDTGEGIKISKTGQILDGQHRLLAIIRANVIIKMLVITNIDDVVIDVLDTGKIRNASDVFYISGLKKGNMLPSIISTHNGLLTGRFKGSSKHLKLTNQQLLKKYYERSDFYDMVAKKTMAWYLSFSKIIPPSFIGGFYSLFYDINPEKGLNFIDQLCTGSDIENNVILLLRNKLINDKMSLRKLPLRVKYAYTIKTWNFYILGKNRSILQFNENIEEFPTAIEEF